MAMNINGPVDVEGDSPIVRADTLQAKYQLVVGVDKDNQPLSLAGDYPLINIRKDWLICQDANRNLVIKQANGLGDVITLATFVSE